MSTLERAIAIAVDAHKGQVDKAGAPYILHPLRVMLSLTAVPERIVAVLHDVCEDCEGWSLDRLRDEGFGEDVIRGLDAVTKRDGEDYDAFVARAASDPVGRAVKRADLIDNSDLARIDKPTPKDLERIEKYRRALERLGA